MKKSKIIEIALNSMKESHDPFKPEYGTGDVIHDCPKHVEVEGVKGKVVSHTLNEQGDVNYIDIDFGTGKVYENVPTSKVKIIEGQSHQHEIKEEPVNEAEYAVGGMFKAIADVRANQKKLFALHDKLQAKRTNSEDQIDADIESLHNDRQQLQSDMENDPEVIANVERGDSGPVAEYGEQLMAVDDQIAQLMSRKAKWAEKAKTIEDQMKANHKKLGELSVGTMTALRGENMTKSELKQIIKEELTNVVKEDLANLGFAPNELIKQWMAMFYKDMDNKNIPDASEKDVLAFLINKLADEVPTVNCT